MKNVLSWFKKDKVKDNDTSLDTSTETPKNIMDGYKGEEKEENPQKYIHTDKVGGRSRDMILNSLGINDSENVDDVLAKLMTENDVDEVIFTRTVPSGLSETEINDFCDLVQANISIYRKEVKKLHGYLDKSVNEILRVDSQAQAERSQNLISQELVGSKDKTQKMEGTILKMQQENQNLHERINKLQKSRTSLPKLSDKENKDIVELKNKIKALTDKNALLSSELDKVNDDSSNKDSEIVIKKLQEEISELKNEKATKEELVDSNKSKIEELLNQVKTLTDENQNLKETKAAEPSDTELSDNIQKLQENNKSKSTEIEELKNELADTKKQLDTVAKVNEYSNKEELEELRTQVRDLTKQKEELAANHDTQVSKLKEELNQKKTATSLDDYEETIIKQLSQGKTKRSNGKIHKLSISDFQKMKEHESKVHYGSVDNPKVTVDDSKPKEEEKPNSDIHKDKKNSFDNLFNEMK